MEKKIIKETGQENFNHLKGWWEAGAKAKCLGFLVKCSLINMLIEVRENLEKKYIRLILS